VLQVAFTSPWYPIDSANYDAALDPDGNGFMLYGPSWCANPQQTKVTIPLDGGRVGSFTVPFRDPGYQAHKRAWSIEEFATFGVIFWFNVPVLWGPLVEPEWDYTTGLFSASSVEEGMARAKAQWFRIGDDIAKNSTNPAGRWNATIDGDGLELMRKCCDNVGDQVTNDPPFGVELGTDSSAAAPVNADGVSLHMTVERGQEVWQGMVDLSQNEVGPDFENRPVWGVPGVYGYMNVFDVQGSPWDETSCFFEFNCGKDNLSAFKTAGGGQKVTMVHVISKDGKRVTRENFNASSYYGEYIYWDTTDYPLKSKRDKRHLQQRGDSILEAYSSSVFKTTMAIKPTAEYRFLRDFDLGDVVKIKARKDGESYDGFDRITEVVLEQQGATSTVITGVGLEALSGGSSFDTDTS
jgi:hypothetical protein